MYDRRVWRRQTAPVLSSNAPAPLRVQSAYQKLEVPTAVSLASPPFCEVCDALTTALTCSEIFFSLTVAEVERLYPRLTYFEVKADQLIFEEGFPGSAYYILHTGEVRLSSNRKETSIATSGMCFGSLCLKFGFPRLYSAYSSAPCRLWMMSMEVFRTAEIIARVHSMALIEPAVETHSCLSALSPRKRQVLVDTCGIHRFPKDTRILSEGARGTLVFFIVCGSVKVSKDGCQLRSLGAGELFGEQSTLYASVCTATVTAIEDTLCFSLDKNYLHAIFGLNISQFIYRNSIRIAFDQSSYVSQLNAEQKEALLQRVRVVTYAYDEIVISENTSFSEGFWIVLRGSLLARDRLRTEDSCLAEVFDCINDDILAEKAASGFFSHDIVANGEEVAIGEVSQQDIEDCLGAGFQLSLVPGHVQREKIGSLRFLANFSPRKQAVFCRFAEDVAVAAGEVLPSEVHTQCLCLLQQGELVTERPPQVFRAPCRFGFGSSTRTTAAVRLVAVTPVVCVTLNKRHFKTVFGLYSSDFIQKLLDYVPKSGLEFSDLTILRRYEKLKNGSIFLATDDDGKLYGLKRVCRQKVKSLFLGQKLQTEREILELLSHPLIPRLVRTFSDSHYLYFLKEFVPGVILADLLPQAAGMHELQVRDYVAMSLSILEHLHSFDILHRDINPESFLVDPRGYLHLIDVGSAAVVRDRADSVTGSPQYIAPEVLIAEDAGKPADLWSLGIMVFELIYGQVPYGDCEEDPYLVFKAITDGPEIHIQDKRLSSECCRFLNRLLSRDENARGTVATAKADPWLHDFDWEALTEQRLTPGLASLVQAADLEQECTRMRRRWPFERSGSFSPVHGEKVVPSSDEWMEGF